MDHEEEGYVTRAQLLDIVQILLEQRWLREQHIEAREVALKGEMILPLSGSHLSAVDAAIVRDAYEATKQDIYGGMVTRQALRQRVEVYGESVLSNPIIVSILTGGGPKDTVGLEQFAEVYVELTRLSRGETRDEGSSNSRCTSTVAVHPATSVTDRHAQEAWE